MTCLVQGEISEILLPYEGPSGGQLMLGFQILPLALHSFIKWSIHLGIARAMEYKIDKVLSLMVLTFQWRDKLLIGTQTNKFDSSVADKNFEEHRLMWCQQQAGGGGSYREKQGPVGSWITGSVGKTRSILF